MVVWQHIQSILQIKTLVAKLKDLQTQLHPSSHRPVPSVPVIHPEEVPKSKMEYTREVLIKFKEEEGARAEAERQAAAGGGDGGFFGGFGGGGEGDDKGEGGEREGKPDEDTGGDMSAVKDIASAEQDAGVSQGSFL